MTGEHQANLTGIGAMSIWAFIPLMLAVIGPMPPFLIGACANLSAFAAIALWWLYKGESLSGKFHMMPKAYLAGIFGFTLYNVLFIYAMKTGPLFEISLLNYTWPAFLIVFSMLVQKTKPEGMALLGIAACFAGAGFVFASRGPLSFSGVHVTMLLGLTAGFLWGAYSSVLKHVPIKSDQVAVFFLMTGLVTLGLHLWLEPTEWPATALRWGALVVFASGRIAYLFWNYAMKHGSPRLLGSLSYFIPLVSALLLATFGFARHSPYLMLGATLVVSGCIVINLKTISANVSLMMGRKPA